MKALILATPRSGSTFLVQALGSHPDMFWDPAEPLLDGSEWRERFPGSRLNVMRGFYRQERPESVIGMKMTHVHLDRAIWGFIVDSDLAVIHLTRENVLRWAVSALVNEKWLARGRPGHTDYRDLEIAKIHVRPYRLLAMAGEIQTTQILLRKQMKPIKRLLKLEYGEIVGGEGHVVTKVAPEAAERICDFLDVGVGPLTSPRRGVNRYPMSDIIENWSEVREAIGRSKFAHFLEDEGYWNG